MSAQQDIAQDKMQQATKLYIDVMVDCMELHGEDMAGIEAVLLHKASGKFYRITLNEVKEGDF